MIAELLQVLKVWIYLKRHDKWTSCEGSHRMGFELSYEPAVTESISFLRFK